MRRTNSHQKLGRFFHERLRMLTADPEMVGAPHSLSFDVRTQTGRSDGTIGVLVMLVLPSRRPGFLRAVHAAANVAYDWSWNPSALVDEYKLGQFLRNRAREVFDSGSVWFGELPTHTGTGEPIDVTLILVPPACRDTVMRTFLEQADLERWHQ